jgi:hypothetical protein
VTLGTGSKIYTTAKAACNVSRRRQGEIIGEISGIRFAFLKGMKRPDEKYTRRTQSLAIIGTAMMAFSWLYFDFVVVGAQSYLAFAFVFALYWFRQVLGAVLFRMAAPILLPLSEADFSAWKFSVFFSLALFLILAYSGLIQALPSLKKKQARRRRAV